MNSHREGEWLGSPNFWPDRQGHDMAVAPAYVVIHTMDGTIGSANARFQQSSQQVSAHYGVGLDGRLVQWVDEKDAAWHAGVGEVNLDSIGVEHEDGGDYNGVRPDALYTASAALVRRICTRYGIPITHSRVGVSGVIAHRETGYSTACPDALDVDRIIREAAAPVPSPTQGDQMNDDQLKAVIGFFFDFLCGGPPSGGDGDLDAWMNHAKSNGLRDTYIQIASGKAAPGTGNSIANQIDALRHSAPPAQQGHFAAADHHHVTGGPE